MEVRNAGAGAAEVEADLVERVEGLLRVFGRAALEHDVAGLAVEGDQAGAVLFPDVAYLAQDVGGVVIARRRLHAQRVEFLRGGKFVGDFREARDDAAAVAEHRNRAALPVAEPVRVGVLELTEQVVHHRRILLVVGVAQPLQAGHEARPRARFELIEVRSGMNLACIFCHIRPFYVLHVVACIIVCIDAPEMNSCRARTYRSRDATAASPSRIPLGCIAVSSLHASLGLSLAPPSNSLWQTAPEICPIRATPIPAVLYPLSLDGRNNFLYRGTIAAC